MPNALTDRIRGLYAMTQNALASNPYLSRMDPRDTANALATAQSEAVAGIGSNMLPGVGDLVGLAQDANMYWSDPASRRARNYLLTGLGALPFLPALASLGKTTRNVPTSFGNEAGMVAYHGSPHDFDAFDMSKIGTGEGAQAYGHGLYVAESKDVAGSYKRKLSGLLGSEANTILVDGKPIQFSTASERRAWEIIGRDGRNNALATARSLEEQGLDATDLRAALRASKGRDVSMQRHNGSLYTVDLPDDQIAKMLDWDAPLSEQPEAVRAFVASMPNPPKEGQSVGSWLRPRLREGMAEIWSEDMRKAGIPGIKYLDGGSRGAGTGTRNFVVFDDNLLKILSKE